LNTLTFIAPSGSPAGGTVIEQLTTPGNTSGANHIGFFGTGGPQGNPFAVIIGSYQDRTFITNASGTNLGASPWGLPASGRLHNAKFTDSSSVNMDGFGAVSVAAVPRSSGTLLIRFVPSGAASVRTQYTYLRAVSLNASSGVNDSSTIVTGLRIYGFVPEEDSSWTQMAGTGASTNALSFDDHFDSATIHDFFACLSVSPEAVGQRNNFGFYMIVEYL
jgi:hypothetical protein